jgi:hypothetical protein
LRVRLEGWPHTSCMEINVIYAGHVIYDGSIDRSPGRMDLGCVCARVPRTRNGAPRELAARQVIYDKKRHLCAKYVIYDGARHPMRRTVILEQGRHQSWVAQVVLTLAASSECPAPGLVDSILS